MLKLKNKFIFAPIKTGYGDQTGIITSRHLHFYQLRSKFAGAVTPEPMYLDKGLREIPTQIGIDNDDKIEGLKQLTHLIHQFDTRAIAHLNHPGRMANPNIPGNYFLSSTNIACEASGATPKQMSKDDIQHAIDLFVAATIRAQKAGFDMIEIQFGHGYLPAQFISQKVNNRTDEYGGSFENRIKFPLEILDAVKSATDLPVIVRISGDEMIPDGIKLDEMIKFSKILKEKQIEAIHVSAGTVCNTPPWYFQHMFVPKGKTWEFAKKIKQEANIPTIYVGQINTEEDIENLINNFKADYIAIGRGLVADPDFIGKYLKQVKGNVRPCLACAEGCLGGVKSGQGLQCLVNPQVGKVIDVFEKAKQLKNVAIVGGGLAGMQAAVTLHARGHKVTLFEKNKLGGQFNLAYLPPHKETLKKIIDYFVKEIEEKQIPVLYKNPDEHDLVGFDEIVIATGSVPAIAPIKGLDKYFWAEVLEELNLPDNKRVAIIGGGLIGVEVASRLLAKGNRIYIIEMLSELARGMEAIEQNFVIKALQNENVDIYLNAKVNEIKGDKIIFEYENSSRTLEKIDVIVLATGMKEYNPYKNIQLGKPVYVIGDAKHPAKAQDAIRDAYETAKRI
ncbi:MAG: oxidoreductase [Candidatus Marinimicrobia bacterium CG08_land_8_20_14_0_20_45_22]|nr:MAG: oxidoreductase [Candidatus Marinimicrobia bacterium CG08_land_8_20_14_0_20_45_22]